MVFDEQVPTQRRRKRFVLSTATFRLAMMLIYHGLSPSFPLSSNFVSLSHLASYPPCHPSFRPARLSSVFTSTSTDTELRPRPLCSPRRLRPEPSVLILRVRLDELVLQLRLQRVLIFRLDRTCMFYSIVGTDYADGHMRLTTRYGQCGRRHCGTANLQRIQPV